MPPSRRLFRHLSSGDAVSAGISSFWSRILLWFLVGILIGPLHHFALNFLTPDKGPPQLGERLLEVILLSIWPLSVSFKGAGEDHTPGERTLGHLLFGGSHLFTLTLTVLCVVAVALGAALVINRGLLWVFPKNVTNLWQMLMGPVSSGAVLSTYALVMLGGAVLGLPYVFGPSVAVHEEKGFLEALQRSRHLTRELGFGLVSLYGFLFVVVSGAFFGAAMISDEPTFLNRLVESLVICGAVGLAGSVWEQAYRQALGLDDVSGVGEVVLRKRHHIIDEVHGFEK